jgi:hypothetical protein
MPRRVARPLLILTALAGAATGALADNPPPDVSADADFLEFLGSVDASVDAQSTDSDAWLAYLSQADLNRAARRPADARPRTVADKPVPADAGDKKND